jgi:hypothetical protein
VWHLTEEWPRASSKSTIQRELSMALFDAQQPQPPRRIGRYILILIAVIAVSIFTYYMVHNYPEEKAVKHFLTEVQRGDYKEAYNLWQPAPSYTYQNFLSDWGPQGDYGKIQSFDVLGSQSKGSQTVIVTVRINGRQPFLKLMVDRKTKGLAYNIF